MTTPALRTRTPRGRARRGLVGALVATALLAAGTGQATAGPGDDVDTTPLPCLGQVTGTLSASPTTVDRGSSSTLTWSVGGTATCKSLLDFKVGATFASSPWVGTSGSRSVTPTTQTTYRLWASDGDHERVLASRVVSITGEIPVTAKLSTFTALDADEESAVSNGDEPWLMVFPIFADGTTVDVANLPASSVRVMTAARAHGNLNRTNVYDGHSFPVPADTGTFSTRIQPVRGLPTSMGKSASTVGLAVIALEQDGTPDSAANAGRVAARDAIASRLNQLVRNAALTSQITQTQINQMQQEVTSEVVSAIARETILSLGLLGVFDPDDFVGAGFVRTSQTQIEAAGTVGVPVNLTFTNDTTSYRVTGSITRG